jgi:hypothetical protein
VRPHCTWRGICGTGSLSHSTSTMRSLIVADRRRVAPMIVLAIALLLLWVTSFWCWIFIAWARLDPTVMRTSFAAALAEGSLRR